MKKVADKAYLPAMRELLDYYTAIRDGEKPELFEDCPLCKIVESTGHITGVSFSECDAGGCPWVVYDCLVCWDSKQVYSQQYKRRKTVEGMRNSPTKRWLSTRIRQLTSWIEKTEAA